MLRSRDGLPYSAFRFLIILILIFNISIIIMIVNISIITIGMIMLIILYIDQVSPVCIAACGGFTLVEVFSGSYSWLGGHKKCNVSQIFIILVTMWVNNFVE